ncbi:MAG: XRE family transcriptional regulator [Paludibacteraceae bacterium]
MEKTLHIGNEIRCELLRQERSVAWLARQLGYDRSNFYRVLRAPSIDTALLLRISHLLQRDFFSLYSLYYTKK